jgi:hypothetical protein
MPFPVIVRVVDVHVHFTVLVALTFGELLNEELLIEQATPSAVLPRGAVGTSASFGEHADITTAAHERKNVRRCRIQVPVGVNRRLTTLDVWFSAMLVPEMCQRW